MDNKKAPNLILLIVAIILGVVLFKQFDFEKFKFQKPVLAVVYIIVFVAAVFLLVKNNKKSTNNQR